MSRTTITMRLESSEIQQNALLDLYILDLTKFGGDQLYFHSGKNELSQDVVWQGQTYGAYPIIADGFEFNSRGASNRPSLVVANITGLMTGLNASYDDLVGARVSRKQVYAKHLDAINFPAGNQSADPTQEVVSLYYVEQLESMDAITAKYTLALPIETDNLTLPRRVVNRNVCWWQYRSAECSYDGGPAADELNQPTSDPAKDKCSKSLNGCKLRFGDNGILPFGGFPTSREV